MDISAKDKGKQSNIFSTCLGLLAGINYSEEFMAMYLQEYILQESVIYQKLSTTNL